MGAIGTGPMSSAAMCSPCPTTGSTRGSPPGTSLFTPLNSPASTRLSPSRSSCCCCANGTCTRTARCPPTNSRFRDVNPAGARLGRLARLQNHRRARLAATCAFLESAFQKLLMNFTWWVNRKDSAGRNLFSGGFLGLDNIGVFDRSKPLGDGNSSSRPTAPPGWPTTASSCSTWRMELAQNDPVYEDIASKFFEHFVAITNAINTLWRHRPVGRGGRLLLRPDLAKRWRLSAAASIRSHRRACCH